MDTGSARATDRTGAALMDALVGALQFLTILPLGPPSPAAPRETVRFFPVAGIVVGALVSAFDALLIRMVPLPVAAVLDVALLALVTGALHLDGLADAADGLLGHHDRPRALAIMKDSRVGAMGLVMVVLVLMIKAAALGVLEQNRALALILVPAYARCAMLAGIRRLPYARPEGGTAHDFCGGDGRALEWIWLVLPFGLSLFLGWQALVINGAFLLLTALILRFYRWRIGGITGDLLGAQGEWIEALLLVALAAGGGAA